jgi:hypothetical protein
MYALVASVYLGFALVLWIMCGTFAYESGLEIAEDDSTNWGLWVASAAVGIVLVIFLVVVGYKGATAKNTWGSIGVGIIGFAVALHVAAGITVACLEGGAQGDDWDIIAVVCAIGSGIVALWATSIGLILAVATASGHPPTIAFIENWPKFIIR